MKRDKGKKGKSKNRIKNWTSQFENDFDLDHKSASRETFSKRQVKLGDGNLAARFSQGDSDKTVKGQIISVSRHSMTVRTAENELRCGILKTFRPPNDVSNTTPLAIGDYVTVLLPDEKYASGKLHLDQNRQEGMIISRELRSKVLARPETRRGRRREEFSEQFVKVIAANMDHLLVVAALKQPRLRRGLIDRFMISAQRGDLGVIIVFNKTDIADIDSDVKKMAEDFQGLGAEIYFCSALTGNGIPELATELSGKKIVLAGASGVGKTTLINALFPGTDAVTNTVRAKDDRGRHTTSQSRTYDLPDQGIIVDTPGIRELGVGINREELRWFFPDLEEFAQNCKFNNCTHTHEPQCAVIEAVDAERLPARRYDSYLRILETIE